MKKYEDFLEKIIKDYDSKEEVSIKELSIILDVFDLFPNLIKEDISYNIFYHHKLILNGNLYYIKKSRSYNI